MKFTPKVSGVMITEFTITPLFNTQFVSLDMCQEKVKSQCVMNYILDTLRFYKGEGSHDWYCVIDHDTNYKLAILENYPEYEKEMISYFGKNWLDHYIRFNH